MRHEGGFIQMKYFVTQVNFAFDEEWISKSDREAVTEDHWGIWEADNVQAVSYTHLTLPTNSSV